MNFAAPAQLAGPWGIGPWGRAQHALANADAHTVEPPTHLSTVTVTFNPPAAPPAEWFPDQHGNSPTMTTHFEGSWATLPYGCQWFSHATSYPNYYRILWNNANADSAVKTNQNGVANAICASTWHWCYDSYSNMICPKDLPSAAKDAVKLAATVLQPRSMSGEEEPIV